MDDGMADKQESDDDADSADGQGDDDGGADAGNDGTSAVKQTTARNSVEVLPREIGHNRLHSFPRFPVRDSLLPCT
jgi:hypothetical protein